MQQRLPILVPQPAFPGLAPTATAVGGVVISQRNGLGLATIQVRRDQRTALASRMREHFHIELPAGPRRTTAGDLSLAGIGPAAWLACCEHSGNELAWSLKRALADLASVSDQTDAYAVLRIAGPRVLDTLCKLMALDVHPRNFRIGDIAVTSAAHIGATVWRLGDQAQGLAVFEIAVSRSMAMSFCRALAASTC